MCRYATNAFKLCTTKETTVLESKVQVGISHNVCCWLCPKDTFLRDPDPHSLILKRHSGVRKPVCFLFVATPSSADSHSTKLAVGVKPTGLLSLRHLPLPSLQTANHSLYNVGVKRFASVDPGYFVVHHLFFVTLKTDEDKWGLISIYENNWNKVAT